MTQDKHPVERCVDLFVYAPIGIAMFAKDTVPTFLKMFIARGQTELDQRRKQANQQANQYKTVGQFAVKYGGPVVKRQAEEKVGEVRRRAEETFNGIAAPRNGATPVTGAPTATASGPARVPSAPPGSPTPVDASHLPIPDYDELSASQVVERLDGLTPDELAAVRDYESAHRARNTVLGKISQLTT